MNEKQDYDDYVTLVKEIERLRHNDDADTQIDALESRRCRRYHALSDDDQMEASHAGLAPEYVTCVKHTREDKKLSSWCGRHVGVCGFMFQDIDHAAYARMGKDRLLICPACLNEIKLALETK